MKKSRNEAIKAAVISYLERRNYTVRRRIVFQNNLKFCWRFGI